MRILAHVFFRLALPAMIGAAVVAAQNPAVTVQIDPTSNRHAINPDVYGVAYGDATTLPLLNVPVNRLGGNNTSRYNWQVNADNRASDWYFESIGYASSVAGEGGDTFISNSHSGGAQPMITIPMVGYVAKLGPNRGKLASFSQSKYGAQTGNDWQWFPDAGNGVLASTGQNVVGNDPNDADLAADSTYQQGWVQHIVNQWGRASAGGLLYYILDNEPSLWHSTHRDVHPVGAMMSEISSKMIAYAGMIKTIDPGAKIVGPEEWGWSGYLYSGYDQQYGSLHGWSYLPDRAAHGGMDYLPWLLSQLKAVTVANGLRPLDVFSVHYYPQGGEFSNDVSTAMQLLRNQSTRSLWDPNYVDQSWINTQVMLIPRLKNWVATYYYAGTPVGVTEYNWGAEAYMNGATAQADILGIFGREGLDLATRWSTPDPSTPTFKAIQIYRNYDGLKSTFGDTSVSTTVPNPDNVSAFSAVRTGDGALTVMVINKYLTGSTPVTLSLGSFSAGSAAHVWQLAAANSIQPLADIPVTKAALSALLPPQSITLFVVPASAPVPTVVQLHGANGRRRRER
ncbi:MAG: glycoside hydrolase family 44 protein [Opitutaceae bacterium]